VPETGTTVDVTLPLAVSSLEPPVISGQALVGRALHVTDGEWSVDGVSLAYTWLRDGAVIEGATLNSYRLTTADVGASITAVVTATKEGYGSGSATAEAVSVPRLGSVTIAYPDRVFVRPGQAATVTVIVLGARGIVPTGDVRVVVGKEFDATVSLDAQGRATVALPTLSRGIHTIRATYGGSAQLGASTSVPIPLLVR
jgi:5'-nucleotidase